MRGVSLSKGEGIATFTGGFCYHCSMYPLLERAPKDHSSPEFLDFLRENNPVLWEDDEWLAIENCKYGWPTVFAKVENPGIQAVLERYSAYEWKVKPETKRTVGRFHIHILV